jgi:UDP-glucose 4-epimerase
VYGDGRQTRCFGYVADAVKSALLLMDHPDTPGEIFNVGTTEEVSINHLAERIIALTGSASKIVHIPYDKAYEAAGFEDMPRRVPDTSKAARVIGFTPRTSLDDILRSVIAERTARSRVAAGLRVASPAVAG